MECGGCADTAPGKNSSGEDTGSLSSESHKGGMTKTSAEIIVLFCFSDVGCGTISFNASSDGSIFSFLMVLIYPFKGALFICCPAFWKHIILLLLCTWFNI